MSRSVLAAAPTPPDLRLLQGGQEYFPALMEAIAAARQSVQLETYIFDVHGAGSAVAQALMQAAERGVAVQVLVDGLGTPGLPAPWLAQLQRAGVQWRVFAPLARSWAYARLLLAPAYWRRLHRKLCVVDEHVLFCGGINVLDDLYDPNHGALQAPRFDFAVRLEGAVARQASQAMALLWTRVTVGDSVRQRQLGRAWEAWRESMQRLQDHGGGKAGGRAHLLLRDNLRFRNRIERAYRKAIGQAREEVLISNAYFLPGGRLRRALIEAAGRGVRVRLLLQGRYEYFMQYHAARSVYLDLLQAGVEVHEYDTSFLHAKVAVIDGRWSTVGSSNLDPLSLLLAREANVVIEDQRFAEGLRLRLEQAIAGHGRRVQLLDYSRLPWRERLMNKLAYALMRIALFLSGHRY
ncbi:MAG: cardiolipin synthase ClsB [Betaproteobacteria bacterium]